jgi:hypothetical protein
MHFCLDEMVALAASAPAVVFVFARVRAYAARICACVRKKM